MTLDQRILRCVACGGQGKVRDQHDQTHECPVCHDVGVTGWWAGQWWTWSHPISEYAIYERALERFIKITISGLLLSFAVIGLGAAIPFFFQAWLQGRALDFLLSQSWMATAGWLGWLGVMYLFYRFERQRLHYPRLPAETNEPAVPSQDPWADPKKIADISTICTPATISLLERTWRATKQAKHDRVTPAHVLALVTTEVSVASMLVRAGLNIEELQQRLEDLTTRQAQLAAEPVLAEGVQEMLVRALLIAAEKKQERISPPHIMAAIAQLEDPARELLFDMGVDEKKLQHVISWLLLQDDVLHQVRRYRQRAAAKPKGKIDRGFTGIATPILDRYSTDLTLQAKYGHLPYVVGRDDVVQHVFRLMEGGHRSAILVGENGVGKTNVLYAVAQRMVTEDVPEVLEDKRLVSLSASSIVAGAGGIGQLEERVETLLDEVIRSGNIVLAIENLDQFVGVTSTGSGMDLATMIAQPLQQHLLLAIATAEVGAYRQSLEHGSLLSAFEKVEVPEMNVDQAIMALESRVSTLENRYKVFFSFDALDQAVSLSQRYIHEKTLPGKAWELLEEAGITAAKQHGAKTLVSGQDVASIVSQRTKSNVSDMTADEQTKLLHLEEHLHRRIVGQEEAVKAVANAMRRARAELRDANRPIANLLFLGPTGVGKTELAKTLSEVYFGSESAMIRLDMSEYQDVNSINRLIGAPPGFTGSAAGGYLTEAVRNNPFSLVLLDELEKAHPDVLNVFLQVMDDGRLTDSTGRTIDFTNVILIATSNAGTQHIQERLQAGAQLPTIKNELMNTYLQKYFRPEFLNRFDSIIVFTPLNIQEVEKIVALMIGRIAQQMALKGISFQASPPAIAELAQTGFDPMFGARPLRRAVQEHVDNALAQYLIQGKLGRRDVAVLEAGGAIRVQKATEI